MALDVPDLRDDVIALRRTELRDADQVVAALQDPDIPRYTRVPTPYARADFEEWLQSSSDGWAAGTDAPPAGNTDPFASGGALFDPATEQSPDYDRSSLDRLFNSTPPPPAQ